MAQRSTDSLAGLTSRHRDNCRMRVGRETKELKRACPIAAADPNVYNPWTARTRPASTNRTGKRGPVALRGVAPAPSGDSLRPPRVTVSSLNRTLQVQVQVQAQEPIRYYKDCYTVATLVGGLADTARFNTRGSRPPAGVGPIGWAGAELHVSCHSEQWPIANADLYCGRGEV